MLFLILAILLIPLVIAETDVQQEYYNITVNYDKGTINLNSINKIVSKEYLPLQNASPYYFIVGFNEDNEADYIFPFGFNNKVFAEYMDPATGEIFGGQYYSIDNFNVSLYIPYEESINKIVLYDSDRNEKLVIEVDQIKKENRSFFANLLKKLMFWRK